MLRTNQSKITTEIPMPLASMCRAMPFSSRALKERIANNDARLMLRKNLNGTNWIQQLQPWTAVSTLLGLVSTAYQAIWSNQLVDWYPYTHYKMVMTSDGTRIQILANWPVSHAKRVTRDNRKNPEYHVVVPIRKLRTDTNCPAGKYFLWRSLILS